MGAEERIIVALDVDSIEPVKMVPDMIFPRSGRAENQV